MVFHCHGMSRAIGFCASACFNHIKANPKQHLDGGIIALCKQGRVKEALFLVNQQRIGMDWNTCVFLLQTCAKCKSIAEGKSIHAHIIMAGVQPDVLLQNNLINTYGKFGRIEDARQVFDETPNPNTVSFNTMIAAYAKCGRMEDARQVFLNIPECDVVSWNTIIAGFSQNGHAKQALEFFQGMQGKNVKPDHFTFGTVLKACTSLAALEAGKQVHNYGLKFGVDTDTFVGNTILDMYSKSGNMADAHKVFDRITERDICSWNPMIAGYAANGDAEAALSFYHQMQMVGIEPSPFTYPSVLSACASLVDLKQAVEIHEHVIEIGFESDVFIGSALIDVYAKCGSIDNARSVFDKIPKRSCVCWTTMIAGYTQSGLGNEALNLFCKMQHAGVKPNPFTFATVTAACAGLAALGEGLQVHTQIIKMGYSSDVYVSSSLLDMYGKCARIEDAQRVFAKMPKSVVSWNAMISAHVQTGNSDNALKIFFQMQLAGIKPNEVTFASVLRACASLVARNQGSEIHNRTIKIGLELDVFVGSALVDMYAKCGAIENAFKAFNMMPKRNEVSWNAMITGYAQHGCGENALQLFEEMQQDGIKPNCISFISVLSACSHVGLVTEGRHLFNCMIKDHNIMPTMDHYACLVDLFGRAGLLEDAKDIIDTMPFDPGTIIWQTLLAACRIHGNRELAQHAAERILELEPQNPATYVLLSNTYAMSGRWNDAEMVRKLMNDRGLKKETGYSWIQV